MVISIVLNNKTSVIIKYDWLGIVTKRNNKKQLLIIKGLIIRDYNKLNSQLRSFLILLSSKCNLESCNQNVVKVQLYKCKIGISISDIFIY